IKSEMLANCDFLVGNLETALATPGVGSPNLYKNFAFLAPLAALDWMQGVNMTVVSLANNHALDYGGAALLDELRLLPEHNILGFGAGGDTGAAFTPKYYIYQDTVIGFVGVNGVENSVTNPSYNSPGNAYFDYNKIVSAIKTAKENADIVVVFPHWGTEGSDYANSFQKSWAQTFVNAGADLVVGAGPHKVQEYVEVGGKPVYYSLGNFAVFGFYYSPGGSVGAYMQATVSNKQIISTQQTKVLISYYGLPVKLGENPADPYPGDAFGPL
ncbi:CapA family protein, partial [Candidatus Dojkabacteria bacterium]|nr:CapA family protein [Candidatus Dojkabacteria bacterium]